MLNPAIFILLCFLRLHATRRSLSDNTPGISCVDKTNLVISIPVMEIIREIKEMQEKADELRAEKKLIGLVPTMGYLHQGHLELVRQARRECDVVIVSIFVNPSQFGPGEDLSTYPRDFESDKNLLEREEADYIFYPSVREMYPESSLTSIFVSRLSETLCGAHRPGHFEGVLLVVAKLFNISKPHRAYFGEKDYQQQVIIRRMVADLNFDVEIVTCPTVREDDGLAVSSRNKYLTPDERTQARILNQVLTEAAEMVRKGERNTKIILDKMRRMIREKTQARVEYVSAVDPETLADISNIEGPVLFALALKLGKARLIDNRLVEP